MIEEFRIPSRSPAVEMEPLPAGETPFGRALSICGFHPKDVLCVCERVEEARSPRGPHMPLGLREAEGARCYQVAGLGGRHALAFALGSRAANPGLTLVVFTDSPDLEDLAAACRKNLDLTCVTPRTGLLPVAQAAGATFLCRANPDSLASSLAQAMQHKGFSLVELADGPPEVLHESRRPVWERGCEPRVRLPVPMPEPERLSLWERLL
ncbi:MAG: hypothetical protein WC728_09395 [Elusimicrobiota bacterium]